MLLIDCPNCGRRPEVEFSYGGEAHIARAAEPSTLDDATWTAFLYARTKPEGAACRAVAAHPRLRPLFQRAPGHDQ